MRAGILALHGKPPQPIRIRSRCIGRIPPAVLRVDEDVDLAASGHSSLEVDAGSIEKQIRDDRLSSLVSRLSMLTPFPCTDVRCCDRSGGETERRSRLLHDRRHASSTSIRAGCPREPLVQERNRRVARGRGRPRRSLVLRGRPVPLESHQVIRSRSPPGCLRRAHRVHENGSRRLQAYGVGPSARSGGRPVSLKPKDRALPSLVILLLEAAQDELP